MKKLVDKPTLFMYTNNIIKRERKIDMFDIPVTETPETLLERKEFWDSALRGLTKRESEVIVRRFVEEKTLKETGENLLTAEGDRRSYLYGERARQIEAKALRKLKHPRNRKGLRPYTFEMFGYVK